MSRIYSRKHNRETIIAAIRKAAKARGGGPLSFNEFLSLSKIGGPAFYKHFLSWKEAIVAAGFNWHSYSEPLELHALLPDWGNTVRKLGHLPTFKEHKAHGRYNPKTIAARCGDSWRNVPACFRKFAGGKEEWADVLALLPPPGSDGDPASQFQPGNRSVHRLLPRKGEHIFGPPLNFRNLIYAPVSEMGVVHLFGSLSAELGFLIESIHGAFPDCIAKQRTGPGEWRQRRIEFEYESRNFRDHGHPPEGCDIIVCWNHNWPECPENIEVIALSEELKKF